MRVKPHEETCRCYEAVNATIVCASLDMQTSGSRSTVRTVPVKGGNAAQSMLGGKQPIKAVTLQRNDAL